MIGYNIYFISWKYLSYFGFFDNFSLWTKIGSTVNFYSNLLGKNSTISLVFSCSFLMESDLHIIIRVSLCLVFHLDDHESNPWKILIITAVRNIDWHSFNFSQLFFVLITVRTIWTLILKHFIVSVVVFEKEKVENQYIYQSL